MRKINSLLYFDTPQFIIDALIVFAQNEPTIVRVTLFGSRVSGKRRPKSDQTIVPDLDAAYELDERVCESLNEEPQLAATRINRAFKACNFEEAPPIDLQYLVKGMILCTYVANSSLVIFDRSKITP
ncbi:MAG: hypothetical protein WBQ60_00480 [Asticcacaulis sp.]